MYSHDMRQYRESHHFCTTNRGGKGVKTMQVTEKTGKVVSIQSVSDEYDLMIITRNGTAIRTAASDIRLAGRATQGVKIINLRAGDSIASVMAVPKSEETEEEIDGTIIATGEEENNAEA